MPPGGRCVGPWRVWKGDVMAGSPVRTTTLRNHLKEATGLRVSADAAERLTVLLVAQLGQVAQRAKANAALEERSTLLERDVEQAFDGWLEEASPSTATASALLTTINGLSNEALTQLIKQLQAQLDP